MSLCRLTRKDGNGYVYVNPRNVVSIARMNDFTVIYTNAADENGPHYIRVKEDLEDAVNTLNMNDRGTS